MSDPIPAERPCIVAGFDGSAASRAAVSLAVRRARDGGRVIVVHAFKPPSDRYGQPNAQHLLDAELASARKRIDRLAEEVPLAVELHGGDPMSELSQVDCAACNGGSRCADC